MSEAITEKWCQVTGLKNITWYPNFETPCPEYWMEIGSDNELHPPERRIGVRFNEHPLHPFRVWLFTGSAMVWLRGVTTAQDFYEAHRLIAGKEVE
jgi:hypothetical protein